MTENHLQQGVDATAQTPDYSSTLPFTDRTKDQHDTQDMRRAARAILGADGVITRPLSFAQLANSEVGWSPLLVLMVLAALDAATGTVLNLVGPEASNALGISDSAFATIAAQRQTFVGVIALVMAAGLYRGRGRRGDRAFSAKLFGAQSALAFALGGLVTWPAALAPVIGPVGAGGAAVYAIHPALLMDYYPPPARVRALSIHRAGAVIGALMATGLVALLTGAAGFTWRATLLCLGGAFLAFVLAVGSRLREPGYGRFDTDAIARLTQTNMHGETSPIIGDPSNLRFSEIVRKIWYTPSVRPLLVGWAVLGVAVAPLATYQAFFLQERFHLGLGQRSGVVAGSLACSVPALWWFGARGESAFRANPGRLVTLAARAVFGLAIGCLLAVTPVLGLSITGFALIAAGNAISFVALTLALLSVVRPRARPAAAGLATVFFALIGGLGGAVVLGSVDQQWTSGVAIAVLAAPAALASWLLGRGARGQTADLDRLIDETIEAQRVASLTAAGVRLPLLTCRNVDFCYEQLQVLFDVSFTVGEGEMVALLGTNGAGKSTLLRAISGLGLPSGGSIRFLDTDVTYVEPQRRVALGIQQIAGGRGTFPALTVVENLRAAGYSLGRDRKAVDRGIDATFDAFPVLAQRRNQHAVTLSGGENQMLALGVALMLRPRLLLIDELSLGLAPKVVGELLAIVRRINANGTAVVLVEQSVNIALSLVQHAYFMEKGQIQFDGPASTLLNRHDLLRSVFLEGAAQGLMGRSS